MFYVSRLVKCNPMRASNYLSLPKELKTKQLCLNIRNDGDKCFIWPININTKKYLYHGCTSEKVLTKHLGRCKLHGSQRIKPREAEDKKGHDKIKLTKTEYQLRLPFLIHTESKDSCEHSPSMPDSSDIRGLQRWISA